MNPVDRRSALALGLATSAALPALLTPTPAFAERYRAEEGKEIAPGVRRIDLTKRKSEVPGYSTVAMRDHVYQPGAKSNFPSMPNDMVCHCLEGELQVHQGSGMEFTAKAGDVWSCKKGMPEADENKGAGVAIMRVIDLIA
jgi:quercetin dioxygenase-like cupin family protein